RGARIGLRGAGPTKGHPGLSGRRRGARRPRLPVRRGRRVPGYRLLKKDVLINADIWAGKPKMMAAGLGFTHIIGVPGLNVDDLVRSERLARAAGGTWNTISCASGETPGLSQRRVQRALRGG